MALVELRVECVDGAAAAADASVFVRCTRQADASKKKSFLRLELLCGPRMWHTEVHEKHKPAVLDCSAIEFLTALESAFTLGGGSSSPERFSYKWSVEKAALTLSERATSGFAMKYVTLNFTPVASEDKCWQNLLHDVGAQSERSYSETMRQRQRIKELEEMLMKKDALLETALTAKQKLEDDLFTKFCGVLNGKKEEIERLQRELAIATAPTASKTAYKPSAAAKKKRAAPGNRKKSVGAKLRKKPTKKQVSEDGSEEEEGVEEEEESEDESESDHTGSAEDDDEDSPKKRKRGAIDAYSQLASQVPMSSQVCAAADVLDDLDAIMKTEVDQDDVLTAPTRTTARKRPPPASVPRSRSPEKKSKTAQLTEESSKPKPKTKATPKPKAKPATPPRKPVDSEEEDILDMLS